MAYKLKAFLRVLAHTLLSFIAALSAGFMFYAFIRPIVGKERYSKTPHDPVIVALLLVIVLMGGVVAYRRWTDRCAFFAWVIPALWLCHLTLSRGMEAMRGRWSDPLFFFGIGAAYSVGALLAAMIVRKSTEAPTELT
jgi:hypothetical protein